MRTNPTLRLHERISADLKKEFSGRFVDCNAPGFTPDLVIANGERVAVIEIKTGDPTLPLPSSANAQMLILKDGAQTSLSVRDIVPVLVTNYQIDEAGRKELEHGGVRVVTIQGSTYDSKALSEKLGRIVGASPDQAVGEQLLLGALERG